MSIKIYEGRKVEVHHSLSDIMWFCNELRAKLEPKRLELFKHFFPEKKTRQEVWSRFGIKRPGRDSFLDFGAELVWFPLNVHEQLVIPFFDQREYREILDAMPGVSSYGYWDNSDLPEDVTAAQWEERSKDWAVALLNRAAGIPAQEGFTIRLLPEGLPLPWEGESEVSP